MVEAPRHGCYILTDRDTLVKGFVSFIEEDRVKLEIDVKEHPHLYNKKNFTFTNIFVEYKPQI